MKAADKKWLSIPLLKTLQVAAEVICVGNVFHSLDAATRNGRDAVAVSTHDIIKRLGFDERNNKNKWAHRQPIKSSWIHFIVAANYAYN